MARDVSVMFDERSRHAELTATGRGSKRMWIA
jgi:hypothetical protein